MTEINPAINSLTIFELAVTKFKETLDSNLLLYTLGVMTAFDPVRREEDIITRVKESQDRKL